MELSVTAYNNLQVAPYELTHLLELKLVKKINDHARLYFTGIVPEEDKDSYVEMTKYQTQIEVSQIDDSSNSLPIFKGIVLNIAVKSVRGVYYIEAEAVSNTYDMDIKLKNRSFQNKGMAYKELIDKVISSYSGADTIDTASNGSSIGKIIIQYNETDWQFLKRMASRFNVGLVPDAVSDKPKFWFGTPEGVGQGNLENFNYSVTKNISDFRYSSENFIPGIEENDFVYYEVETHEILNIGYQVNFKGKSLFVCQAVTIMKDGVLKHQYTMAPKKGLSQNTLYNNQIIGLSLEGRVIDVSKDNVRVHLDIDDGQGTDEAWWFHYSSVYTAEGSSGWYCMPELNDHVRIYFSDNKEENAIAISSVRKNSDSGGNNKFDNPDVKYFRTKSGKELKFSPDEILITAQDGSIYIRLSEKDGIQICSNKGINITSQENIMMDSQKKVIISAQEAIDINCKESSIKMDGSTSIKGNEVKTN
ncbi:hypothetical protein [Clostridium sp. DJ247]|uniref:hypothetical protein n=1 Tax=Clostridium sp. DJ247 TaxID=2726188 RepID=UPI0016287074|nr:hypothetical protein [Clostridium sp. DJ247]MBC2580553.1 hypothetical protein [Clostridium sp. DJ247]